MQTCTKFLIFVLLLVYPTPSYDDNNGRSRGFIGPFLWLPLSIAEAATGFGWIASVRLRQMKSSSPCVGRRSAAFFPRSFLAFHRNTATALGFEPAGHRRRCLAVRAAFAPQTAVPYLLQGKGGRPYGGILWSRFSRWALLDRAGLDRNTGTSYLVSAISYSQNVLKLEDRQNKTYLSFWI